MSWPQYQNDFRHSGKSDVNLNLTGSPRFISKPDYFGNTPLVYGQIADGSYQTLENGQIITKTKYKDCIFALNDQGNKLYCLDAFFGNVLWTYEFDFNVPSLLFEGYEVNPFPTKETFAETYYVDENSGDLIGWNPVTEYWEGTHRFTLPASYPMGKRESASENCSASGGEILFQGTFLDTYYDVFYRFPDNGSITLNLSYNTIRTPFTYIPGNWLFDTIGIVYDNEQIKVCQILYRGYIGDPFTVVEISALYSVISASTGTLLYQRAYPLISGNKVESEIFGDHWAHDYLGESYSISKK
jgi:hypothetical protein